MSLFDFIYIRQRVAVEVGMTHEGRMFGVPAWLAETADNEVTGCPKIPALQLWCMAIDWLMEQSLWFVNSGTIVESPITIGRRITP